MADPRRILLVGGTGRVGRMVLHHWRVAPPLDVEVIVQHRDPDRETGLYWSLDAPLADPSAVQGFAAIVCLAGVTPGPGADLSQNKTVALSVLETARQAGIPRVLLASSSAVYGAGCGTPFSETDAPAPVNDYGAAKVAMEAACTPFRANGRQVCCLRIGNVAGADALLLNAARAGGGTPLKIDCFADGRGPVRSYIGAGTLAAVLVDLALTGTPLPPVLNIAAPGEVFMEDLARAAAAPYDMHPAPAGAYQRITLECHRLGALHAFAADASDPVQMVGQWKEALKK